MSDTIKPILIINEEEDINALTNNILHLSLENNKELFFKVDVKNEVPSSIMKEIIINTNTNNINKKRMKDITFKINKKAKSL